MLNLDPNRKLRSLRFLPGSSGIQESYQEIQESKIPNGKFRKPGFLAGNLGPSRKSKLGEFYIASGFGFARNLAFGPNLSLLRIVVKQVLMNISTGKNSKLKALQRVVKTSDYCQGTKSFRREPLVCRFLTIMSQQTTIL